MCGIAGVVGRAPETLRPLRAMTAALRHRGPDDEGYLLADSRSGRAVSYGGADTVPALGLPRLPESTPPGMDVGLGSRAERVVVITTGLVLAPINDLVLPATMALLATTAWITVLQRILFVRKQLRGT